MDFVQPLRIEQNSSCVWNSPFKTKNRVMKILFICCENTENENLQSAMNMQRQSLESFKTMLKRHALLRINVDIDYINLNVSENIRAETEKVLNHQYDLVHVTSHGELSGMRWMRDPNEKDDITSVTQMLRMFAHRGSVLVLACCKSAEIAKEACGSEGRYFCAIGTTCELWGNSSSEFSKEFYRLWSTNFLDSMNRRSILGAFVDLRKCFEAARAKCHQANRLSWSLHVQQNNAEPNFEQHLEQRWTSVRKVLNDLCMFRDELQALSVEVKALQEATDMRDAVQDKISVCDVERERLEEEENITAVANMLREQYANLRIMDLYAGSSFADKSFSECYMQLSLTKVEHKKSIKEVLHQPEVLRQEHLLKYNSVLISGAAGGGKSTFLTNLCFLWANGRFLSDKLSCVFRIDLANLGSFMKRTKANLTWVDVIVQSVFRGEESERKKASDIFTWCKRGKGKDRILWLFDGYDEIYDLKCELFIELFHRTKKWHCPYIVTCRHDVTKLPCTALHAEIGQLSVSAIESYLKKYFKASVENVLQIARNELVYRLLQNPLYLLMFCRVGEKFLQRKQRICPALLYSEVASKAISRATKRHADSDQDQVREALQLLAWESFSSNSASVAREGFEKLPAVVRDAIYLTGLLRNDLRWMHETFQEFFAAEYAVKTFQDPSVALKRKTSSYCAFIPWLLNGNSNQNFRKKLLNDLASLCFRGETYFSVADETETCFLKDAMRRLQEEEKIAPSRFGRNVCHYADVSMIEFLDFVSLLKNSSYISGAAHSKFLLEAVKRGIICSGLALAIGIDWLGEDDVRTLVEKFEAFLDLFDLDFFCYKSAFKRNKTVTEMFLERGGSKDRAAQGAGKAGNKKLLEFVLGLGGSIDKGVGGAAEGGHEMLVFQLLDKGADKKVAIKEAAKKGHFGLLSKLVVGPSGFVMEFYSDLFPHLDRDFALVLMKIFGIDPVAEPFEAIKSCIVNFFESGVVARIVANKATNTTNWQEEALSLLFRFGGNRSQIIGEALDQIDENPELFQIFVRSGLDINSVWNCRRSMYAWHANDLRYMFKLGANANAFLSVCPTIEDAEVAELLLQWVGIDVDTLLGKLKSNDLDDEPLDMESFFSDNWEKLIELDADPDLIGIRSSSSRVHSMLVGEGWSAKMIAKKHLEMIFEGDLKFDDDGFEDVLETMSLENIPAENKMALDCSCKLLSLQCENRFFCEKIIDIESQLNADLLLSNKKQQCKDLLLPLVKNSCVRNVFRECVLHCSRSNVMIETMIDLGADPNDLVHFITNPEFEGCFATVRTFVRAKQECFDKDLFLKHASFYGNVKLVVLLLRYKAKPSCAVQFAMNLRILNELLCFGANVIETLEQAIQCKRMSVIDFLLKSPRWKKECPYTVGIWEASKRGFRDIVFHILNLDVSGRKKLLHYAVRGSCAGNHPQLAAEMVQQGADVNHVDDTGRTALCHAVENNHADLAQILIVKFGADASVVVNGDGISLLAFKAGHYKLAVDLARHCERLGITNRGQISLSEYDMAEKCCNTLQHCSKLVLKQDYLQEAVRCVVCAIDVCLRCAQVCHYEHRREPPTPKPILCKCSSNTCSLDLEPGQKKAKYEGY